mmetsp:Transcript_2087/g.3104  ORF Transcript_2087/g.3104 Transcript_2087/m.3104 type:complete len:466 (-) Transcript_2087:339-1736(-)
MKYYSVVILLAGVYGLAVGEVATCADFFNPFVSSFRSLPSCHPLVVEGDAVGVVTSSDVVKSQGPNQGETCIRFTFVVRNGLGIRRVKVGLWNREIPLTNARFTRKRKFLDSEPATVRVDACLDDIQTEADCCGREEPTLLVAEAKVRMEDGEVATATLSGTHTLTEDPESVDCGSLPPVLFCDPRGDYENGDGFLQCELNVECDNIGGEPEYIGLNRIDPLAGELRVIIAPTVAASSAGALQVSVYESTEAGAISVTASALTVRDRSAISVEVVAGNTLGPGSLSVATFSVPELATMNVAAIAVTTSLVTTPEEARYSMRLGLPGGLAVLEFISFSLLPVIAGEVGPVLPGVQAAASGFGPFEETEIVGRIGSVICGYCQPDDFPPRGEWSSLPIPQTEPLNSDQFAAEEFRLPDTCIFLGAPQKIGAVCGPPGEEGLAEFADVVQGQVVCTCSEPTFNPVDTA